MNDHIVHLNEDQLVRAVVDENDLTVSERNHLLNCELCMKEKRATETMLCRLGDMSREAVSAPERRFMPAYQKKPSLLRLRYAMAAGCAVLFLVIGIWWGSLTTQFQGNGTAQVAKKTASDQQIMEEVVWVEDTALPDRYLFIVGSYSEDFYDNNGESYYYEDDYYDPYDDDEFLEFVLPL